MGITASEAKTIAQSIIAPMTLPDPDEIVLVGEPLVWEHGWVFFYNSKIYTETGELSHALGGNAPIIVLTSGEVRESGTAHPIEYYLDQLRAELGGRGVS